MDILGLLNFWVAQSSVTVVQQTHSKQSLDDKCFSSTYYASWIYQQFPPLSLTTRNTPRNFLGSPEGCLKRERKVPSICRFDLVLVYEFHIAWKFHFQCAADVLI